MKTKANLLIIGNLLTSKYLRGGQIEHCPKELLEEYYDTSESIIIQGDVIVDSLDCNDDIVVVTGAVSTRGGSYGTH